MTVLLTIAGLAPRFGGPSRSVPALAEALARQGVETVLFACESAPGHGAPILPDPNWVETRLLPEKSRRSISFAAKNPFFRSLRQLRGKATVIHDNGLWLSSNHAVARAAQNFQIPRVVSLRGMLTKWSMAHHSWKKRLAWLVFQRRDLLSATILHATSEEEIGDCRRVGLRQPVALVPNGVYVPEFRPLNLPPKTGQHTALCMARLHPKKGLNYLIEAWSEVRPQGWRMVIAGDDGNAHAAELKAAVDAHNLKSVFEFTGEVDGARKWGLFQEADLFVLPSHSENFGISIAEALGSGVPVITTRGTPWRELLDHQCGWWEEVGSVPLANALREATALSQPARRAMGDRGRMLIRQKYSWQRTANEFKDIYTWMLGEGECPPSVRV